MSRDILKTLLLPLVSFGDTVAIPQSATFIIWMVPKYKEQVFCNLDEFLLRLFYGKGKFETTVKLSYNELYRIMKICSL